jgi:hypothetical protein
LCATATPLQFSETLRLATLRVDPILKGEPLGFRGVAGADVPDDQFEFALDLLLDGIERLRQQEWTSTNQRPLGVAVVRTV